jgi:hypothetical protein
MAGVQGIDRRPRAEEKMMSSTEDDGNAQALAPKFTRVTLSGAGDVIITQGDVERVEAVSADGSRGPADYDVHNGELVLHPTHGWMDWFAPWPGGGPRRYYVTMRKIEGLRISGAGSIEAGHIETDRLELVLSGAGDLEVGDLQAQRLEVHLHSVGNIEVAGKVAEQSVRLSGAGSYQGGRLESQRAEVRLSGLGNATLWVVSELDAHISGAGSVEYYGNPTTRSRVSGLGSVQRLGERPAQNGKH